MAKMRKEWVALCSTAIAVVYTAGYWVTEAQASIPNLPVSNQTAAETGNNQSSSALNHTSNPPAATQSRSQYIDGTYTGTGINRRGNIEVTVSIKNDKITDVEVSKYAMHYSQQDIIGLPDEVLQKQSAQVDNVSGATYSTRAFADAVQNALSQARNG